MVYGFIGLGNMATAIIGGMRASDSFKNQTIVGYDPVCEQVKKVVNTFGITRAESEREVLSLCDVAVLCVKPQVLPTLLPQIAPFVKAGTLVITIAAGKTLSFYEDILPSGTSIVRVMPNINAQAGAAATALCGGANVTDAQLATAVSIFDTVGKTFVIEEGLFSAFTAMSGSSVAFAYMYMDAIAKAGAEAGFDPQVAREISAAAAYGSAVMMAESPLSGEELVKRVCSPGGTTIEGVSSLEEDDFQGAITRAFLAVMAKDKKLSQG